MSSRIADASLLIRMARSDPDAPVPSQIGGGQEKCERGGAQEPGGGPDPNPYCTERGHGARPPVERCHRSVHA
eukprot:1020462-Prymnesium_polylepis.1